jgi:hypothetical protein
MAGCKSEDYRPGRNAQQAVAEVDILECAAAGTDRKEMLALLARRLENLAFVVQPESLPQALDTFRILQSINEDLAPLLGRAIATARLGLPRIAAA